MLKKLYTYYIENPDEMSAEYRQLMKKWRIEDTSGLRLSGRYDRPVFHGKVSKDLYTKSMGSLLIK